MRKVARYTPLNRLKGLLKEKGFTYRKMAEILNMSSNTFSDKLNGFALFDAIEISKMADILNVEPEDIKKYFFPTLLRISTKKKPA